MFFFENNPHYNLTIFQFVQIPDMYEQKLRYKGTTPLNIHFLCGGITMYGNPLLPDTMYGELPYAVKTWKFAEPPAQGVLDLPDEALRS